MRPKPSEPGRGLSFAGVYFLKAQRGYTTGSRSPSGQEGPGREVGGRCVCVCVCGSHLSFQSPLLGSSSGNEGVPAQAGEEPSAGTFLC